MAQRSPLRSARKRELYRLIVARSDMLAAMESCDLILGPPELDLSDPKYLPLFHAATVAYARPFSANRPHGPLPARWSRFADASDQHVHDTLIDLRNQFVAHSDQDAREVLIWPPGSRQPGTGVTLTFPWVSVRNRAYPIAFIRAVRAHCLELGRRINAEIDTLMEELYGNRVLPVQPFPLVYDEEL